MEIIPQSALNNYRKTVSFSNNSEKRPYDMLSTQFLPRASFHALITVISSSVASMAPNIHKERGSLMLLFSKVLFRSRLTTTVLLSCVCVADHTYVCTTDAPGFELISLHNGARLTAGALPGMAAEFSVSCCALRCCSLLHEQYVSLPT